jgi:HD-GYP domain-containing protein (c-di-GMP phosphodiesterase class II)
LELVRERIDTEGLFEGLKKKKGKQFDPGLFPFLDNELLSNLNEESAWEELESSMQERLASPNSHLQIAGIFGKMVDLKSKYTSGHSSRVVALAKKIAESIGLDKLSLENLELASNLKDLGMLSISNRILEKSGKLTRSEWESIRLHPYISVRILSNTPLNPELLSIIDTHHESVDGKGYYRSLKGNDILPAAQILHLADSIVAMESNRSFRDNFSKEKIRKSLIDSIRDGKIQRKFGEAGIEALGFYIKKKRPQNIAGLTDREIEVLEKICQGKTNAEIAMDLKVSTRTIQHHSIPIYNKIGVSSRAAATLFASKNGII